MCSLAKSLTKPIDGIPKANLSHASMHIQLYVLERYETVDTDRIVYYKLLNHLFVWFFGATFIL